MIRTLIPIPFWPKPFVVFDMAIGQGDMGAMVMAISWKIKDHAGHNVAGCPILRRIPQHPRSGLVYELHRDAPSQTIVVLLRIQDPSQHELF